MGSQKQLTLQRTWAEGLALPFPLPQAKEGRRSQEMEWRDKHIPSSHLILSVPGPALGFVGC